MFISMIFPPKTREFYHSFPLLLLRSKLKFKIVHYMFTFLKSRELVD